MRERLGEIYLKTGFIWLLVGMTFGAWLGATENLQYSNPHAHANLVGFVLSALFGLIVIVLPALRESRLAVAQYWIYQIGAVVLVVGKILVSNDPTDMAVVAIGSLIVLVGTLMFAFMLFTMKRPATAR
ncbi:hypothetical protein [Oceanibacterium hippocampi]|uniref:Uncharacterized protein n=1 Tax=Oceanibacterium hippocampi TaxID=745714 RepID=A0A1Y5TZI8_9PROT|nr:hypothetical protein [Oceanibacterium hippocampi]SLN77405.1 hypothetical protein OCH7691_04402 [Oceanibacterium hippocampi]